MAHRPKIDNAAIGARSNQNLSCNWTGSADFGRLVPIHWEELLQTDKVVRFKPRVEMQMLPLASPTFGKIDLYVHGFVVPIRQLQTNFYDIWSQTGTKKDDEFVHVTPKILSQMYNADLQQDTFKRAAFKHWTSFGLPPFFELPVSQVTDNVTPISIWPFLAYNKVWWDFYRDPEVLRDESRSQYIFDSGNQQDVEQQGFVSYYMMPHVRSIKNNWISDLFAYPGGSPGQDGPLNVLPGTRYPWSDATGNTIDPQGDIVPFQNDGEQSNSAANSSRTLRVIEALTRLSERLSLSGKREIEALFARYGVKPKWSQMNLARYVGGAKSSVLVSDIISNSDTASGDVGSPLGAKAGAGYCALDDLSFEFEVDEPSIFICIASVMPHIHYVQGLSKKWQRLQLPDLFNENLQFVGQVAVAKREVAVKYRSNQNYVPSADAQTFAFSDPYYEYKMGLDILAGDFMKYHGVNLPQDEREKKDILYMQSMEQYIDFPFDRQFKLDNLLIDGDQYNKIFSYLGGSIWEDVDDHFHLCIDKEFIINRPMEGYAIPTLETTQDPHKKTQQLSSDKML